MYNILRKGGDFVCKIFDIYRPFNVGLFYLLYRHFDRVAIFKPLTSRPANSERYVVCKGFKERLPKVTEHLFKVNDTLGPLQDTPELDVDRVI
eukprot:CAMPEP_0184669880 /NCGR_PEP_ID=MMETSP0308-20130426/79513_1 /TAXON_ID=38269 /ORGANISM="Gloeochaete witrockiana, Strain SAG 46.84" /LENGTH=92 /DNA_ID=CAMNT_0027116359 /DNA_START=20 /DNA_END=295 /DNA_ORIENTATION=-